MFLLPKDTEEQLRSRNTEKTYIGGVMLYDLMVIVLRAATWVFGVPIGLCGFLWEFITHMFLIGNQMYITIAKEISNSSKTNKPNVRNHGNQL